MAEHTETPWLVHQWGSSYKVVQAEVKTTVKPGVTMSGQRVVAQGLTKPDATLIVKAVNNHAALVEALREAVAFLDKQREDYNAMPSVLPREPVGRGPLAVKWQSLIDANKERV